MLEASPIAFSNNCFEFAGGGPEEAQHDSLANFPKILSSHLQGLSKVSAMGFCAQAPPGLLFLFPYCDNIILYDRIHTPVLCFARALRVRGQLGRSGTDNVSHGSIVTKTGGIGDW